MPTGLTVMKKRSPSTGKVPGFNIRDLLGLRATPGDIGLEVEVEGNKFPKSDYHSELIPPQWKYTPDGSLRGQDNAEYILRKPLKFEEVDKAVDDLWKMFDKFGSKLDDSNRTSIHVHLNAQEFHLNRLTAFAAIYFCLEELLTAWCGDHRVGNMFCLRSKDAPAIITKIKNFVRSDGGSGISEGLHYSGFNAHALSKYGSIEIRTLRGVNDPKILIQWVRILERLYKLSGEYKDPREVVDGFSGQGPIAFFENMLGDQAHVVRNGISYTDQQVMNAMYEGIRLAQDICYCRDWSKYRPTTMRRDPFRRRPSTVAASLAAAVDEDVEGPAQILSHAQAYTQWVNSHTQWVNLAGATLAMNAPTPLNVIDDGPTTTPMSDDEFDQIMHDILGPEMDEDEEVPL